MGNSAMLRVVQSGEPNAVNGNVSRRRTNLERRPREHLTPSEVDRLIAAAGAVGRHGHRDATVLLLSYRHGLRVGEAVALRWDQVDLHGGLLHVARLKNGTPSTHPLRGLELRALRKLRRESPEGASYVFMSERKAPMTPSNVRKLTRRAGMRAGLGDAVHPHMLRHSAGYKLGALDGHDTRALQLFLGHRSIAHTARYIALAPDQFKTFWRD